MLTQYDVLFSQKRIICLITYILFLYIFGPVTLF